MPRTRVKFCGLTSAADAREAVRAGADALGVVFADSPRRVEIEEAVEIFADVPPFVTRVGVFVNASQESVEDAVREAGLQAVQFHGDETAEQCAALSVPVIKAFRAGPGFAAAAMEPFRGRAAAILLDTYSPHLRGGTGEAFSWSEIPPVPGWAPLILAGGLSHRNVQEAIRAVHPFAVDVSSGVESRVGHKDAQALRAFVDAVRQADREAGVL